MSKNKYLLLYSGTGLDCSAYDTYEEAYKTMETEFEQIKEGIRKEYNLHQMIWFINECYANGAVLETLDEKYMLKWEIVKLTEEGQIAEISYKGEYSKSQVKEENK